MHTREDIAAALAPYGLTMAYVSQITGKEDDLNDYDEVRCTDAATGEHLFTLTAKNSAGDMRGFPANVYALPDDFEHWYDLASDRYDDEPGEWDHLPEGYKDSFRELIDEYNQDEDRAITFLLHDTGNPDRAPGDPYRYEFVAWMPPDDDYDLEEEIAERTEDWRENRRRREAQRHASQPYHETTAPKMLVRINREDGEEPTIAECQTFQDAARDIAAYLNDGKGRCGPILEDSDGAAYFEFEPQDA